VIEPGAEQHERVASSDFPRLASIQQVHLLNNSPPCPPSSLSPLCGLFETTPCCLNNAQLRLNSLPPRDRPSNQALTPWYSVLFFTVDCDPRRHPCAASSDPGVLVCESLDEKGTFAWEDKLSLLLLPAGIVLLNTAVTTTSSLQPPTPQFPGVRGSVQFWCSTTRPDTQCTR
jgi:hypothetical protein